MSFLGYTPLGDDDHSLFSINLSHLDRGWNQVSKWSSGSHETIGKDVIIQKVGARFISSTNQKNSQGIYQVRILLSSLGRSISQI